MRAAVPFLLLSIPLVEIALFVVVGDAIGLWATLGMTVAAAAIGLLMIRGQGLTAVQALRPGAAAGEPLPLAAVARGAAMVAAGMLLLIPGFLTDLFGLSLLLPPVRRRLGAALGRRLRPATAGPGGFAGGYAGGPIIDAEAVVVPDRSPDRLPDHERLGAPDRKKDEP